MKQVTVFSVKIKGYENNQEELKEKLSQLENDPEIEQVETELIENYQLQETGDELASILSKVKENPNQIFMLRHELLDLFKNTKVEFEGEELEFNFNNTGDLWWEYAHASDFYVASERDYDTLYVFYVIRNEEFKNAEDEAKWKWGILVEEFPFVQVSELSKEFSMDLYSNN